MATRHVLYVSGSIGLGHVTRDLAIAAALRACRADVRLVWLAGEELLPECQRYEPETAFVETIAGRFSLRLLNPAVMCASPRRLKACWQMVRRQRANVRIFKAVTAQRTRPSCSVRCCRLLIPRSSTSGWHRQGSWP